VVDCVADVAAIAERLGLDRFAVTGGSGGGPHALAVAAPLPDRVTRASCFVGGAPFDAQGLDWFAGMDPSSVTAFGWAQHGEGTLTGELQRVARQLLVTVEHDPTALLGGIDFSESDRAVRGDPGFRETLGAATREMLAQGVWGWVDDDLAFVKPWGFDVSELRVPVEIRYGAKDVLVPAAHGKWLAAHVPGATVVIDDDGGHLNTPDERLKRLQTLAAP
jgi:pimeloyl-ACP methyl ester carboxylesterase